MITKNHFMRICDEVDLHTIFCSYERRRLSNQTTIPFLDIQFFEFDIFIRVLKAPISANFISFAEEFRKRTPSVATKWEEIDKGLIEVT